MTGIAMILSNPYRPDIRVEREALSLRKSGYNLTIICWDRKSEFPQSETIDGIKIIRIQNIPSGYGYGWRQLFHIPRFWLASFRLIKLLQPEFIHAHDLDTLPAGVWAQTRLGCRLVFDAHEDYPSLMSLYLPKFIVCLLKLIEGILTKRTNVIITASNVLAEKYRSSGVKTVVTIGNYQDVDHFTNVSSIELLQTRRSLGYSPDDYIVSYIGGFSKNRLIIPLIEAIQNLPDVHLLLAGEGHQREAIKKLIANVPNIRYLGWIRPSQVPLYTMMSDVVYYCLHPNYPGAIYNAPNTLSMAMAAGKPIIANNVGDLGSIVSEVGCGILLEPVNPDTIITAIESLRDDDLRKKLGQCGHFAAQTKYNWASAEKLLIDLYQGLCFS